MVREMWSRLERSREVVPNTEIRQALSIQVWVLCLVGALTCFYYPLSVMSDMAQCVFGLIVPDTTRSSQKKIEKNAADIMDAISVLRVHRSLESRC